MNYITVKQVAERTGLSPQTVRKRFPAIKFGRSVRIWEGELSKFANRRALAAITGDPGLKRVMEHYRAAEAVIEYLDPNPDATDLADPDMALLLVSTIAAGRAEHPEWEDNVIGVDAVFPPVLAFLKANPPQGGGAKGDALRELIRAA